MATETMTTAFRTFETAMCVPTHQLTKDEAEAAIPILQKRLTQAYAEAWAHSIGRTVPPIGTPEHDQLIDDWTFSEDAL